MNSSPLNGKRILLLAEYGMSGGTRTYIKQLLHFYAKSGARVTMVHSLLAEDREMEDLCNTLAARSIAINSLSTEDLSSQKRQPILFFTERKLFRNLLNAVNPDRVVASTGTPGLFLGALSLKKGSILVLHTYPHGKSQRVKLTATKLLYRWLSRGIKIVTVSHRAATEIASHWWLPTIPEVCYNSAGPLAPLRPHTQSTYQVLTVGHVVWYKNPFFWIDVARLVHEMVPEYPVRFVWLGDGPLLEDCRTKVVEIGAEDYIEFRGFDPHPALEYARATLYVQPSLVENLAFGVLDAMRYGMPTIVSNIGGLPELTIDGRNGFTVSPDRPIEFAGKIVELLHDQKLRMKMGQVSRKIYKQNFTPEQWEKHLTAIHRF